MDSANSSHAVPGDVFASFDVRVSAPPPFNSTLLVIAAGFPVGSGCLPSLGLSDFLAFSCLPGPTKVAILCYDSNIRHTQLVTVGISAIRR